MQQLIYATYDCILFSLLGPAKPPRVAKQQAPVDRREGTKPEPRPSDRPVPTPRHRDTSVPNSPHTNSPQPTPRVHKREGTTDKARNPRAHGASSPEGSHPVVSPRNRTSDRSSDSPRDSLQGRTSSVCSSASSISSFGTSPRDENQNISKSSSSRKESSSYKADRNKWVDVKQSVESMDGLSVVPVVEENGHNDGTDHLLKVT